jgi:hypothetical protein
MGILFHERIKGGQVDLGLYTSFIYIQEREESRNSLLKRVWYRLIIAEWTPNGTRLMITDQWLTKHGPKE